MALLRSPSSHDSQENAKKASSPMGDQLGKCKSPFGFYTEYEMLVWLKGLALDPCDQKASPDLARQLRNQSLKVRKLLLLGNDICPRSKRKLDQFLKGSKFTGASGLATEKSDVHSVKRMVSGNSFSCVTNTNANIETFKPQLINSRSSGSLLTFEDEYQGKQGYTDLTMMDMESCGPTCNKDNTASPLIDTDESNNGLNTLSLENLHFCDASIMNVNDTADSSDSSCLDEHSSELERALRLMIFSDDHLPSSISERNINSSSHHSDSLKSKKQNLRVREAVRLLFLDRSLPRAVVPIGPSFQAEVPEWTGPVNRKDLYGGDGASKASRWLGTRMWPIKGKSAGTQTTVKALGKGRSNSCSCISPGSVGCVKHHIHEARLHLQSELGPAFLSWKFDEMGEFVSKSWTSSEQQNFESLLKTNPLSNEASFWKIALKRFPSKCRKSILSYYYNVFTPRRMSVQTRSSFEEIDSDDDE